MDEWVRSSFCADRACVEVAFQRSSACESTMRVEVVHRDGQVLIRDSKNPERVLTFSAAEWDAFLRAVAAGEFG